MDRAKRSTQVKEVIRKSLKEIQRLFNEALEETITQLVELRDNVVENGRVPLENVIIRIRELSAIHERYGEVYEAIMQLQFDLTELGFSKDLESLIKFYNDEKQTGVPDDMLADYLMSCITPLTEAIKAKDELGKTECENTASSLDE